MTRRQNLTAARTFLALRAAGVHRPLPGQPAVIHICDDECNPGNCETAHREDTGWDAVESGERFAAEMGHLR